MCCITINTEVLFANFFGCEAFREQEALMHGVELTVIERCALTLSNNLPGYVFFDLSERNVERLLEENKDYYRKDGKIFYRGDKIQLEDYNSIYIDYVSARIREIVTGFFNNHLYNEKVQKLAPVLS